MGMASMAFALRAAGLSLRQKYARSFLLASLVGPAFLFPLVHPLKWTTVVCTQFLLILSPERDRVQQAFTHQVYRENGQAIFVSI